MLTPALITGGGLLAAGDGLRLPDQAATDAAVPPQPVGLHVEGRVHGGDEQA